MDQCGKKGPQYSHGYSVGKTWAQILHQEEWRRWSGHSQSETDEHTDETWRPPALLIYSCHLKTYLMPLFWDCKLNFDLLSFVHCRNPLSARPDFLILKQNVCNNYLRVTKTLKILQVRGKCPVSWLNTRSILKNHLGVFFEIISAIDCITNSLLKVSYCAKIGNLVISQFTSYDFIYVIKPVNDCTSGWNPQLALLLTFSPQAALY